MSVSTKKNLQPMQKIKKRLQFGSNFAMVLIIGTVIGTGDMYLWAINRLIMD